ncbi:FHA domain containing protein [Trichomonas vaginalis G3]|uniref:FHA domain containing protein n=1 Tax=Trichomonas vaginalis (strain ATCC PRA-98 / G3) TaxID=412133 RepID=A2FXP3_TRIV3|nr:G-quadruplex RNA binding [Trichomonas vaginalis G3]EAX90322.1 FHA domain containing protein [Trichomonas vaginalis G3]KAI5548139.1 G-quadruplex RNA binding [Trichomonas vaginalis G3]|eukprot:XP_001303252.1 FHA domain containing protein [Trichomonas vaginalis G3]
MTENENKPWTAEEDAFCVWCFFCSPVASFPNLTDIPGSHTPQQILERFLQLMKQPLLLERVKQFCNNNIFQFRGQIPFTTVEDYYLVNSLRLENTSEASDVTKTFGNYFHISRTLAQLRSRQFALSISGKSLYQTQLDDFIKFKKEILKKYTEDQLTQIANTVDQLTPYFLSHAVNIPFMEELTKVLDEVDKKVQSEFQRGEYAALLGKLGPHKITKPKTLIGRNSQFIGVDIDLTPYHIQTISRKHASIKLCTDFNYYIECLGSNIIINGKLLLPGEVAKLSHRDIIDIGGCLLLFLQNNHVHEGIRENMNKE